MNYMKDVSGAYRRGSGEATFLSGDGTEVRTRVFSAQTHKVTVQEGGTFMPPRNPELPEGTDHIINGAMDTGNGGGGGGFVGASASDDTAGLAASGGSGGGGTGAGSGGGASGSSSGTTVSGATRAASAATDKIVSQVRDQVSSLQGQAADKIRQFAETGKGRATTALTDFSEVINDAARSVDARLGGEYGQYAHRAADAINSFVGTLRDKSVDELLDDTRSVVRRSPGVAIGAAALVGFALARVVRSGMPEQGSVDFQPDAALTSSGTGSTPSTGA
jgi:hypothetical protein